MDELDKELQLRRPLRTPNVADWHANAFCAAPTGLLSHQHEDPETSVRSEVRVFTQWRGGKERGNKWSAASLGNSTADSGLDLFEKFARTAFANAL